MTNLIIASFTQEAQALTAFRKLTELESIGDLTVYESILVQKTAQGETGIVETGDSTEGVRTLSGMALGTLVGAFAGPVGILAGMLLGTMGGALWEANYYNFTEEFSSKVADSLKPGYTALIAEVDEDNEVFADTYIISLGGTLLRTDVDFEYEKIVDEQVESIDEQIAADRAKLRTAEAAERSRFEKEIADLKEKRKQRIAELKSSVKKAGAHTEATLREMKATRLKSRIELYKRRIAMLEAELGKLG